MIAPHGDLHTQSAFPRTKGNIQKLAHFAGFRTHEFHVIRLATKKVPGKPPG